MTLIKLNIWVESSYAWMGNGVFSKWSGTFIEFRESEESLKHELGSISLSSLLAVCLWHSGRVSVSHTGDSGFKASYLFKIIIFLSLNSAKTPLRMSWLTQISLTSLLSGFEVRVSAVGEWNIFSCLLS